jgi:hypothetical protein
MGEVKYNPTIIDKDPAFIIDAKTRTVTTDQATGKFKIMQFDHNSERFRFVLPAEIEGHQMDQCNKVQIHWYVIGSKARDKYSGVINIQAGEDGKILHVSSDEKYKNYLEFSWLITDEVTQYAGALSFVVLLAYEEDDTVVGGKRNVYRWCSDINSSITIANGIDGGSGTVERYDDVLLEWKNDLDRHMLSCDVKVTNHILGCEEKIINDLSEYQDETTSGIQSQLAEMVIDPINFATNDEVQRVLDADLSEFEPGTYFVCAQMDTALSETSENPVQNKVIAEALSQIGNSMVISGGQGQNSIESKNATNAKLDIVDGDNPVDPDFNDDLVIQGKMNPRDGATGQDAVAFGLGNTSAGRNNLVSGTRN